MLVTSWAWADIERTADNSPSEVLLTATAQAFELDALNQWLQVEIYSPSGALLATSPPPAGRAVAVTVPVVPGIYTVKVKTLGQTSIHYETLLITRTNWLPGQLQ